MKKVAPVDSGLFFVWAKPQALWSWLPLFLFFSVLAHAGTFFIFHVVYPQRATLPPLPPRITMPLPTPENAALRRWIEAEDPSLMTTAESLVPPRLVQPKYRPSFEVIRTAPRSIAEAPAELKFPSEVAPLAIIRSENPEVVPPAPALDPRPTELVFSETLSPRAITRGKPLDFPTSATPLTPARFLIGLTDRGEVRYIFPQESSGNAKVDAEMETLFRGLSFAASEAPITWGFATVRWGNESSAELSK